MQTINTKYILFEIDRSVQLPKGGWISIENNIKCITYSNEELTTSFSYGLGAWGYFDYGSSGTGTLPAQLENRKALLKVNSLYTDTGPFIQTFSLQELSATESTFYFDISTQVLYVNFPSTVPTDYQLIVIGATKGYANIEGYYGPLFYEGRIRSAPSISVQKDNQFYGIVTYDTGSITLNNTDGVFDNFKDEDIYGAVVKVRTSTDTDYSTFTTIYSGYLDSFSLTTRDLVIQMRDIRKTLEQQAGLSTWTLANYPSIKDTYLDKMIPLAWGKILDAPAVSLDETVAATYTFKFCDTTLHLIQGIDQVYVDGVAVAHSSPTTSGTFILSSSVYTPGEKVTVDFRGYVNSDSVLIENPLEIIEELCSIIDISYNSYYFNTTTWETIKNSGLPACNLYVEEFTPVIELINLLSNSIFGLFLLTQDGKFTYKIKDISAAIKKTITVSELLTPPTLDYNSSNYVSTVNVGFARRYSDKESYSYHRNTTQETTLSEKYRVSKTQYFPTQLTLRSDATTYSQTVLDEFGGIFPTYSFDTKIYNSDIEILDIIEVELYRFTDSTYGKVKVIIEGVAYDYNTNRIRFTARWLEDVTAHLDLATFIKWTAGTSYLQGAVVSSDGQLWRAIVPSVDNKPVPDSEFWTEFGMLLWQDYVVYPINGIVAYNGVLYRAIAVNINKQPDTSITDWERLNSGGSTDWKTDLSYSSGDVVYYSTSWYTSLSNSNKGNIPTSSPASWSKITTFDINTSTATKLATARSIQGVNFDGSAAINIINGTGFVKASGTTLSYDNSTYLPSASYTPAATVLAGYVAATGTISATDTIETAIEKLGYDKHVAVTLATNHGLGLTGQALNMGTPSSVTGTSTNSVTTTTHTHALSAIGNSNLTNSTITVGTTSISLGASATTIAGLSSVTSTTFVGALTGQASNVTVTPTFSGTYPIVANVSNTTLYSIPAVTITGSTGTITATTFIGSLSGNASTVTTLTKAQIEAQLTGAITTHTHSTTIGTTAIATGSSATTIAGLVSVTSTGFTGALTGHASLDLALTGGTMTGVIDNGTSSTTGYRFGGRSFSWNSSMQTPTTNVPHIMQDSYLGWDPILGAKTTNGFWQIGAYSSDELHIGYMAGAFGGHSVNAFDSSVSIKPSEVRIGNIGSVNLYVSGVITGSLTGTSTNATEWAGAAKTISASAPSGGADGDIWLQTAAASTGSITIGTTSISIGSSSTTLAGLTSVSSTTFSGSGSSLTSLNADNISSGTVNSARLPAATTSNIGAIKNTTTVGSVTSDTSLYYNKIYVDLQTDYMIKRILASLTTNTAKTVVNPFSGNTINILSAG